jgi:subtilisin family serine protease
MAENQHKYLKNEPNQNDGFKKTRGWTPKEEPEEPEPPKRIQAFQKDRLRIANALVYSQRKQRRDEKTLEISGNIELIRLHFFVEFNIDLQKKFLSQYGLSVLEYSSFNKSVLFEITSEELFQTFISHVQIVFESSDDDSYELKPYNLIALIFNFEFITDKHRLGTISETGFLLSLVTSLNPNGKRQVDELLQFLTNKATTSYDANYPELIEVMELTTIDLDVLAKNFDIIRLITSSRPVKIRPGVYGDVRRAYGFTVDVPDNLPIVGIIDSGVNNIDPLRPALTAIQFDHTGNGAYWDEVGHGTSVAGLIVLGEEFHKNIRSAYTAKAKIAVIKVIHSDYDPIDIPKLLNDIRTARRTNGVRLFNMSLNLPIAKNYNDSFGNFAYELDKLSYEEDLLIFMSVGNYDAVELEALLNGSYHPSHDYPRFFYEPNSSSPHHACWFTNIQEPSESLNNVSVGALAGNLEVGSNQDITPASEYPAYYSRKFHYDYTQQVNSTNFQVNQNNKHLNKPDLVYEGGDLFEYPSGLEILRTPLSTTERYFGRNSGTSLATPLITSLAAEILHIYPKLKTQTVKALLINNASSIATNNPPAFQNFGINLYRKLIGFGKPQKSNLIVSDDNTAIFVVEDGIELEEVVVIPLKLPKFISDSENKLHFQATLCYSFLPLKDNHLNYLPLHISFGFFKNVGPERIANNQAKEYRIKSAITWSEDFFGVEKRLFSNTQKQVFNLQPYDLPELNYEIAIAIRCTSKKEIPLAHQTHLQKQHPFSLVIAISEIPELRASGDLYNQLNAINTVENIADIEGLADVDLTV